MKLVRYGNPGKEKPGLIDADGKLRDSSYDLPEAVSTLLRGAKWRVDPAEIPDNVKSGLEIVPVARMDDVLQHALVRMPEAINWDEEAEEAAAAARAAAGKSGEGATAH